MKRDARPWLTELRNNKNWSQQKLATEAKIARNYVSEIESGARNPSVPVAQRIASALGFDWIIFFEYQGRETQQQDDATSA